MDLQADPAAGLPRKMTPWRESVQGHASPLDGATATGEAARLQRAVRIGVWLDDRGAVRRARCRTDGDEALAACAEQACAMLEAGLDPLRGDGALAAPGQEECAELVALALQAALQMSRTGG